MKHPRYTFFKENSSVLYQCVIEYYITGTIYNIEYYISGTSVVDQSTGVRGSRFVTPTRRAGSISSEDRYFVFMAAMAENVFSHR